MGTKPASNHNLRHGISYKNALATYIVNECCEVVQCKVGDIPKQYQGVKVVLFDCFCMPLDEVYSLGQRRNIGDKVVAIYTSQCKIETRLDTFCLVVGGKALIGASWLCWLT